MPRKPRVWYPGAAYHIMCRGNHRRRLFQDEADYRVYLSLLGEVKEKLPFLLHAFCLMTNHVHLLIETKDTSISVIMQRLNLAYSKYFNAKYDLIGQLYQGPFRRELVQSIGYFLDVSRYIHRNPLEADIVTEPATYRWSSFSVYIGETTSSLITTEEILSYFAHPAATHYQGYVECAVPDRFLHLTGGEPKPKRVSASQIAEDKEQKSS